MAIVHSGNRRRILSSLMILSMLLPSAGCGKRSKEKRNEDRYASGREISSSDPFFNFSVSDLKIPLDEDKEVSYKSISHLEPMGDYVIGSYSVDYVLPERLMRKQEHPENMTEAEFAEIEQYSKTGTAIFNMQGEIIKDLGGSSSTPLLGVASDSKKNVYLMMHMHDQFYSENWIETRVFDLEGNLKETVRFSDLPVEIPGLIGSISPEDAFIKKVEEEDYEIQLDPFDSDINFGFVTMQILKDGSFLFSKDGAMSIYGRDGNKRCDVKDPERKLVKNAFLRGDKYYVLSVHEDKEKGRNVQIKELNITNGALGQGKEAAALSDYESPVVTENGVYINSLNGCAEYDIDADVVNEVFNWNDTDVNRTFLASVRCLPESGDRLNAIAYDNEFQEPHLIQLTRAEKNPHAGKKIIRIGGMHLSGDKNLMTFASRYNADPAGKTRAVIIDYTEDRDTEVDSAETVKKIYLDILSGKGPDIVVNMGDSEMFRNSRVLEDLNPYLDGPQGIDRTKYFDNIFRACERNGKLYHIPIDFSLEGLMVNTDLISCRKGWTYEEFAASCEALPEEVSILPLSTYNELLRMMLGSSLSRFVNYQDQTVNFQNDEMKKLMDLVKTYGVQKVAPNERKGIETEYFSDGSSSISIVDYTEKKLQEGMLATKNVSLYYVYNIPFYGRLVPGSPAFLGYPSVEGNGMAIHPERTLGILSSGKYKDLAWDLIRSYLEYDNENTGDFGIPVNRECFEKQCRMVMDDANEKYRKAKEDFWMESFYVEVHEEDIDMLRELVENADTMAVRDEAILAIISEDAAGYFAGDRSADDVLSIIQNRTKTVVTEL